MMSGIFAWKTVFLENMNTVRFYKGVLYCLESCSRFFLINYPEAYLIPHQLGHLKNIK